MVRLIMALAKSSKLSTIHPLEKVILTMGPIIIIGFSKDIIIPILNILVFIILHIRAKNNKKIVFSFTTHILIFIMISSITFIFDYGIKFCLVIWAKGISAGLCLSYLSLTTPIDHILFYLSKKSYLKDLCDISKSMERFLITINDEFNILKNSIKSRGGFDTFKLKIKSTAKMAALLFVNTMYRWKEVKLALDSRGFKGHIPYITVDFSFSKLRATFIIIYNILLIFLVILEKFNYIDIFIKII